MIGSLLGGGGGGGLLGGIMGGGGGGAGGILGGGGGGGAQMPGGPMGWGGFPVPGRSPAVTPGKLNFQGNLGQPGAAESYYSSRRPDGGTASSEYWEGVAGRGNTAPPKSTNYAKDAFESARSLPANTASFYDRAVEDTTADVNRELAARGQFGSTSGTKRVANAVSGLRAQQARDDAQYGLQREGLLGSLATGADVSSARGAGNELAWLTGLGSLAQGADAASLARDMGTFSQAERAQMALRQRGQDFFGNQLQLGMAQMNPMLGTYNNMIGADMGLMGEQMDAALGYPREGLNQSLNGRASSEQGIGNLFGLMGSFMGAGGMGG